MGRFTGGCLQSTGSSESAKGVDRVRVRDGRILCEPALWTHWLHHGELETITCTSTLELPITGFLEFLERYPTLLHWGQEHAKKIVFILNELCNISDMSDT